MDGAMNNIAYAFLVGGLVTILATVGTHTKNSLSGTLAGYSAAICAVLLMAAAMYNNLPSPLTVIQLVGVLAPYLMLLAILVLSLVMISINFDRIAAGKVTDSYATFSYISVILILIQVWAFWWATRDSPQLMSALNTTWLMFLSVLNLTVLVNLAVILKYWSTDG